MSDFIRGGAQLFHGRLKGFVCSHVSWTLFFLTYIREDFDILRWRCHSVVTKRTLLENDGATPLSQNIEISADGRQKVAVDITFERGESEEYANTRILSIGRETVVLHLDLTAPGK